MEKGDPSLNTLVNKILYTIGHLDKYLVAFVFDSIVQQYEAALWCTENHEQINAAIEKIKQERLLLIMQSDGVRRANDDLSRSFSRALTEFRKQRQWRMQNNLVDVDQTPEEVGKIPLIENENQ